MLTPKTRDSWRRSNAMSIQYNVSVHDLLELLTCYEIIVILSYSLAFDAPLGGFPLEYRHPLWCGKTRMVSLPDGETISKISLFVLTWSTNVTDGQTDRQTLHDSIDRACIASRGNNKPNFTGLSFSSHGKNSIKTSSSCRSNSGPSNRGLEWVYFSHNYIRFE